MNTQQPIAVNFKTAAEILGMSPSTVSRLVADGDLVVVSVGRSRRIPMSAINTMVNGDCAPTGESIDKFIGRTTRTSGVPLVVDDPAALERLGRLLVRAVTDAAGQIAVS